MGFACSPANVGDTRHSDGRSCERDSGSRRRWCAGVLFHTSRAGAGRHRSDRIDEVVFESDGRTGHRLLGGSSGDDSSGRTPPTETRAARCRVTSKTAGRKPFSIDLAAFEGTAGSAGVALTPSSVGTARIQNALQAIALANGLRRGSSLWSQRGQQAIRSLPLATHTAHRRSELQAMYERFEAEIEELNERVLEQANRRTTAGLLMTHPGVGPITALATDVFLGDPKRFRDGKALASYIGIIPRENSSGGRQRLGGLTKQGNPLLRFLWCEAGAHAGSRDPELRQFYRRKLVQKGLGKARVAAARKLGIRLWIMLRDQIDYQEFCRRGQMQHRSGAACAGMPDGRYGAKSHRLID